MKSLIVQRGLTYRASAMPVDYFVIRIHDGKVDYRVENSDLAGKICQCAARDFTERVRVMVPNYPPVLARALSEEES